MANDSGQITGLVTRGQRLDYTVVRRRKGRPEVEDQGTVDLPSPWGDMSSPEAIEALKEALGKTKGFRSVALTTERALLRVVDLPTTDPAEMPDMVELQVEKISPFSLDQVVLSHETLSEQGPVSRVLMASVQREVIEQAAAPFEAAGHLPNRVDLDVLGWWELIRDAGHVPDQGRQAYLLLDQEGTELVVTQDGVPVLFRALGGHEYSDEQAWFEELADEAAYTLAALESEWGLMPVNHLQCWHWGEQAPRPLFDLISKETGLTISAERFESLPCLSEGLARRAAREGTPPLNLALPEWALGRRSKRTRRHVAIGVSALLAVWALVILSLFFLVRQGRTSTQTMEVSAQRKETDAGEVRRLKGRVDALEKRLDRRYSALECLREISVLLPAEVEISTFMYKKSSDVSIRGQAPATTPVHNFVEGMEKSSLFTEVKTEDIRSRMVSNRRQTTYRLTGVLPSEEGEETEP